MARLHSEELLTIPEIPKELGEDGGYLYKHYDDLADEIDEDLVKSLKAQLDGILIFAGLFAGVNSAFLVFTLPQMSADPVEDAVSILLQMASRGNSSITSAADLPSASFVPRPGMYLINVLFSMSLTLAILSSFLAVLGQQWLVYYRKRSGGGLEHQRWEQLRRYLGAKRWHLELVLAHLLPGLLQIGLAIFCFAFNSYLGTLSRSMYWVIAVPLCVALAMVFLMAICAAYDEWCPFKSPLSYFIRLVVPPLLDCLGQAISYSTCAAVTVFSRVQRQLRSTFGYPSHEWYWERRERLEGLCKGIREAFVSRTHRPADDPQTLKVEALRRVICVSEDRVALINAAMNLQSIKRQEILVSLVNDREFLARLHNMCTRALQAGWNLEQCSRIQRVEARAFSTSLAHLILSAGSVHQFVTCRPGESWRAETVTTNNLYALASQLLSLSRSTSIPFSTICDKCSHCRVLSFLIKLCCVVARSPRGVIQTLQEELENLKGALTKSAELRIGYLVAFGIVYASQWREDHMETQGIIAPSWRLRTLEELLDTFRKNSKLEMVETICNALGTSGTYQMPNSNPELYVRLFESAMSSDGDKEDILGDSEKNSVLGCVGKLIHYIETWIRDASTSEAGREIGRKQRDRCVQLAVSFLRCYDDESKVALWIEIRNQLEPSLKLIATIIEQDSRNMENRFTEAGLRHIFSSLPEPHAVDLRSAWESNAYSQSYTRFKELLDGINHSLHTKSALMLEASKEPCDSTLKADERERFSDVSPAFWGN